MDVWREREVVAPTTTCPRCGGQPTLAQFGRAGVASRFDHRTTVCWSCATHESMLVLRDPAALHPLTGVRRWWLAPSGV